MAQTQADIVSSQAEMHRTQAQVAQAAMDAEATRAKIENLRAAAVANLAKAGIAQQDAHTNDFLAVLELLDRMVGWHQQGTQLAQQQQQIDNPPISRAAA
jgi:hypothetical protein